ncbi:substrate-binding domain-containing protein [Longispora sp. NPDC051575]|uniref:substrate-binding domain-containing protein n=1 Tax=Longispora sp. NPDC051575 TaxID=3154943 RepID=UPI00343D4887
MRSSRGSRAWWRAGLAALLLVGVCAVRGDGAVEGPAGEPWTLRVLAGDELADLAPVLDRAAAATGVTVRFGHAGSREIARRVVTGRDLDGYDAVWPASDDYLTVSPGAMGRLGARTQITSSPVILGLRTSVARQLGWDTRPVSWSDIAAAGGAHRFGFAMSDPHDSHSAVSALLGAATALAGEGAALRRDDVVRASRPVRDLFGAQTLRVAGSGELSDAFARHQGQVPAVDGLFDYESELLALNASGALREPLTLVYPTDGVVTAHYPLSLLASASPGARNAYVRLVRYLRSPAVQREIMAETRRRPAVPAVRPDAGFGDRRIFELPFPSTAAVIDDLVDAYEGTLRRPARTVYVLDTSGSMAGPRLADLQAALNVLTGAGQGVGPVPGSGPGVGPGARFREREQTTLLPFGAQPSPATTFDLPPENPGPVLDRIRAFGAGLAAAGGTAIYDALVEAYRVLAGQAAADPDRITSIVLLTDGENNTGRDRAAFVAFHGGLPAGLRSVPVFPVLFADSDAARMRDLAALTGGRTFDARTEPLGAVFAAIRGHQ